MHQKTSPKFRILYNTNTVLCRCVLILNHIEKPALKKYMTEVSPHILMDMFFKVSEYQMKINKVLYPKYNQEV